MFLIVAEEKAESRRVAIFLKLPGRVPCLYQSVKPLLTSHLWLCEYLSLQKGQYWRKTRKKVSVFFFSITPWCIRQRKTCNSSIPKEVLLFGLVDLKTKGLCSSSPTSPFCPSIPPFPPAFLLSLLCVGRCSTLAVHVFNNFPEYLIVIKSFEFCIETFYPRERQNSTCVVTVIVTSETLHYYLFWSVLS